MRFPLLREVARDLRYLLDRGYRKEPALRFLANRWALRAEEREVLRRGVFPREEALARRQKLLPPEALRGRPLFVDGHNVLVTVESGLLGHPVFLADDGLVRDARRLSRRFVPRRSTLAALEAVLAQLARLAPAQVTFLLDRPLSRSGELAGVLRRRLEAVGLAGEVKLRPDVDRALRAAGGIVATADAPLVDAVEAAFDLARFVLVREGCPLLLLADDISHLENGQIQGDNDPPDNYA